MEITHLYVQNDHGFWWTGKAWSPDLAEAYKFTKETAHDPVNRAIFRLFWEIGHLHGLKFFRIGRRQKTAERSDL